MLSASSFLVKGLLAGLVAGIVAFGVAYVVGEPPVNAGIAFEESSAGQSGAGQSGHDHAAEPAPAEGHGDETVVPRSLQSTAGLLTATVVAGVTLGGLVGVLSALVLGRFGSAGPRATTLAVAAVGFVVCYLIPSAGYPPNPPGVGAGDTIGYRTALYFILTAISVLALVVAVLVGRRLGPLWGGWYATIAAVACYLLITLTAIALLPTYNAVPSDFPATVLFEFRRASLVTQLVLWTVLGLVLAEFVGRLTRKAQPQELPRDAVPVGAAQ